MANPEHVKWLLEEGVNAWNQRRQETDFLPNLEGADLWGADLQQAKLQKANLLGAKLQGANLHLADLRGADLQQAKLQKANLVLADLERADLRGADLRGADLRQAHLLGAKLQEAKLQGANLHQAILVRVDLQKAKLQKARLVRAHLERADLRGADLRGADLQQAKLQKADVRTTKSALRTINAGKADFTFARNLTQNQLETMIGDRGVLLPEGLTYPENWLVWEEENLPTEEPGEIDDAKALETPKAETDATRRGTVAANSSLSSELQEEQLDAIPGPPNATTVRQSDEKELELFQAVQHAANIFLVKYEHDHIQLPRSLEKHFKDIKSRAEQQHRNWFTWENLSSAVNGPLNDPYYKDDWRGADDIASTTLKHIKALEDYLRLVPDVQTATDPSDIVQLGEDALENTQKVSSCLRAVITSQRDRITPETVDVLTNEGAELEAIQEQGSRTGGVLTQERQSALRRTLLRIGGFVVGALKSIGRVLENAAGATGANVITNPAALAALYTAMKQLWDLLKSFFPV